MGTYFLFIFQYKIEWRLTKKYNKNVEANLIEKSGLSNWLSSYWNQLFSLKSCEIVNDASDTGDF